MAVTVDRLVAEIEANPAGAIAALRAFDTVMDASTRDRNADIDVQVAEAMAELMRFEAVTDMATRDRKVNIDVDRNMLSGLASTLGGLSGTLSGVAEGMSEVGEAATDAVGGGGGGISGFSRVAGGAGMAGRIMTGALVGVAQGFVTLVPLVGLIVAGLSLLPGLLASIATAAGVLVAALAPLLGLLGGLVPLLGALGVVGGALFAGLSGVISGVSAYKEAAGGAAEASEDLKAKQDSLRGAQQALANATRQVTMAHRELKDAQDEMSKAPHEAAEAIEDAHFAAAQAILNERQAVIALEEAQKNLASAQEKSADASYELTKQTDDFTGKVYDVAYASAEAVDGANNERDARLAVKQAELDLARARDANQDSQRHLNEMEQKGIKNSDIMVAARRRLEAAEWGLKQAHLGVADAQRRVAEAQKAVTTSAREGTAATQAWDDAMKKLTPTGIEFVKFIADEFMPAFSDIGKAVQDTMLPGIQRGLEALMGTFGAVKSELAIVGQMLGDTFADFFEFWTKPRQQELLKEMFEELNEVIRAGLQLVRPFSRVLVGITTTAAPMLTTTLTALGDQFDRLANWMETDSGKKKTTKFFDDAAYFGGLWLDVMRPLGGVLKAIVRAARPLAERWLKGMSDELTRMSDQMNSKGGQKTLTDYFEDSVPVLKDLWGLIEDITDVLFTSSRGEDSAFHKFIKSLRDSKPMWEDFFENLDEIDWGAIVDGFMSLAGLLGDIPWKEIAAGLGPIESALSPVIKALGWWYGLLDEKKFAALLWELEEVFYDVADAVHELGKKFQWVKDVARETWDDIKKKWEKAGDWWDENVTTPIVRLIDNIADAFDDLIQGLKDAWNDFTGWLDEHIPDIKIPFIGEKTVDEDGNTTQSGLGWLVDKALPGRQFGGSVIPKQPYLVGEKGPELFTPTTSGRIMPASPTAVAMESNAPGITDAQLERVLNRVLDRAKPNVEMNNHFEERVDPKHLASELAWTLS